MITKPVCNPHSKWIFTRRRRHRWSAILVSFLLNTHPNESLSHSLSILLSLFSVCFSVWYSHIAKLTTAPPSSSKLRLQYNPWWPTMTGVQRIRVFIHPPPASIRPTRPEHQSPPWNGQQQWPSPLISKSIIHINVSMNQQQVVCQAMPMMIIMTMMLTKTWNKT